ncbi:unnamed protein product [Leptosia nina]|uniref:Elongation of very long chain fatty acids protein n=1 Tax=Leptosia nina TaxID=320188 RepID=A0AAV1JZ36_9NEOP
MDTIKNTYNYIFEELPNPMTKDWFLVSSPWTVVSIVVAYNVFSRKLGPYLMKDRPAFELKTVIKLYNMFQVLISTYLVYEGIDYVLHKDYNPYCQGLDPDPKSARALTIARNIYIYYTLKLIELLDTVFFVLRKSFRQISPLHLHHHSLMPLVSWMAVKYIPGGQCVLIGWVNSFVHVVMYGYYLISGLGPQYKKYLWWKKYVTVLQLVQFAGLTLHSVISLFNPCSYHWIFKIITICYGGVFMNMFGQFYYQTYIKKKPERNGQTNGVKHSQLGKKKK